MAGAGQSATPWAAYTKQVREAYRLAKGEAAAKHRGRHLKLFDERGTHPFSMAWGKATMLQCKPGAEDVRPSATVLVEPGGDLAGMGWVNLVQLMWEREGGLSSLDVLSAARIDALAEFVKAAKEGELDEGNQR